MRKVNPNNIILLNPVGKEGLAGLREHVSRIRKTRKISLPMTEVWEVGDDGTLIVRFLGALGHSKGSVTFTFSREEWQEKH